VVHVHVHPREPAAVINCFNLEDRAVSRRIEFDPCKLGLDAMVPYQITGATAQREERRYIIDVAVPSYGHSLIEVRRASGNQTSGPTSQLTNSRRIPWTYDSITGLPW